MAESLKVGLVLSATDKMSRVVDQAVSKSAAKFKKFERVVEGINSASNKMFVAGGIAAAGIYKTLVAAEEASTAQARLENVFKQMWGDNGSVRDASKRQGEFAEKLSLQIGVEAKIIKLTQAKLATFKHVSSKTAVMTGVFERATKAAFDMASVGFGEAAQNAVMLGKALEDPARMATALKKMGTVTADDVIQLKAISATKGLAAAQEYLLKAVEKQVKGTGIATVNATDVMKTAWSQVTEAIGGAFLPAAGEGKNSIVKIYEPTIKWINSNHKLIQTIAKIAIGMLALAAIMRIGTFLFSVGKTAIIAYQIAAAFAGKQMLLFKLQYYGLVAAQKIGVAWTTAITAAQWLWNAAMMANPIGLIILGIVALVAIVVVCWKKFATFRAVIKTTWETIKGFGTILKDYVIDRIKGIIEGLGSMGKAISLLFKGKFAEATSEAGKGIKALSGYDAKMKAFASTKKLVGNVSQTYTGILKKEEAAQKQSDSVTAMKGVAKTNNVATNSANSMVYAPVINVASGSPQDKQAIINILKDNKRDFAKMFMDFQNNNKRTSFTPAF